MAFLDETGLAALWQDVKAVAGKLTGESDGTVRGGIAELTAKGHAEQDGTPTPDNPVPIQVVRGRNLVSDRFTDYRKPTDYLLFDIDVKDGDVLTPLITKVGQTVTGCTVGYVPYGEQYSDFSNALRIFLNSQGIPINVEPFTVGANATAPKIAVFATSEAAFNNLFANYDIQLTLSSTPQPYVPYGHVGIDYSYVPHGDWEQGSVNSILGNTYEQNKVSSITRIRIKTPFSVVSRTMLIITCASGYQFAIRSYKNGELASHSDWASNVSYAVTNFDEVALIVRKTSNANIDISEISNVNLIVRGIIPTTTIPLPSRGWVAGLPDGTADALRLDGAGKCEWTLRDDEVVLDGSENINVDRANESTAWNINRTLANTKAVDNASIAPILCDKLIADTANHIWGNANNYGKVGINNLKALKMTIPNVTNASTAIAYLTQNPVTVLYPLATPVTEDCGYVDDWPTDIPEGAVIDIPELSEVGIKFFIDSSVTKLAKQWYARAQSEYETRLSTLESIVAELV